MSTPTAIKMLEQLLVSMQLDPTGAAYDIIDDIISLSMDKGESPENIEKMREDLKLFMTLPGDAYLPSLRRLRDTLHNSNPTKSDILGAVDKIYNIFFSPAIAKPDVVSLEFKDMIILCQSALSTLDGAKVKGSMGELLVSDHVSGHQTNQYATSNIEAYRMMAETLKNLSNSGVVPIAGSKIQVINPWAGNFVGANAIIKILMCLGGDIEKVTHIDITSKYLSDVVKASALPNTDFIEKSVYSVGTMPTFGAHVLGMMGVLNDVISTWLSVNGEASQKNVVEMGKTVQVHDEVLEAGAKVELSNKTLGVFTSRTMFDMTLDRERSNVEGGNGISYEAIQIGECNSLFYLMVDPPPNSDINEASIIGSLIMKATSSPEISVFILFIGELDAGCGSPWFSAMLATAPNVEILTCEVPYRIAHGSANTHRMHRNVLIAHIHSSPGDYIASNIGIVDRCNSTIPSAPISSGPKTTSKNLDGCLIDIFGRRSVNNANSKFVHPVIFADCANCAHCKKANPPSTCNGCKKTKYCNRDCQIQHWKTHKKECKKL